MNRYRLRDLVSAVSVGAVWATVVALILVVAGARPVVIYWSAGVMLVFWLLCALVLLPLASRTRQQP